MERKKFIEDFNKAFATGDMAFIMNNMSEDITWEMVGNFRIKGKEEFKNAMAEMETSKRWK